MKVALFIPCFIDAFFPEVGIATLELLERFGMNVTIRSIRPAAASRWPTAASRPMPRPPKRCSCATSPASTTSSDRPASCVHHVRDHFTAVRADRRSRRCPCPNFRAGRVPARHTESRCLSLGALSAQGRPAQQLRTLRGLGHAQSVGTARAVSSPNRRRCSSKVEGLELVEPARPDECCGFGGTFSVVRRERVGQDGLRQGQRPCAGRRRVHRLGRQFLPDAPARLRRARWACR